MGGVVKAVTKPIKEVAKVAGIIPTNKEIRAQEAAQKSLLNQQQASFEQSQKALQTEQNKAMQAQESLQKKQDETRLEQESELAERQALRKRSRAGRTSLLTGAATGVDDKQTTLG